jgi:hypothetical protein
LKPAKIALITAAVVAALVATSSATAGGEVGAEGCAEFEGTVCVTPCPDDAEVCAQEGTDDTSTDDTTTDSETTDETATDDSADAADDNAESTSEQESSEGPDVGTGDSGLVHDSSGVAAWQIAVLVAAFAAYGAAGWAALRRRR